MSEQIEVQEVEDEIEETNNDVEEAEELEEADSTDEEVSEEEVVSDEVVITIDNEPAESEEETKAPEWVRDLRKSHRELQKQNRELQERLNAAQPAKQQQLAKKPELADFDYDTEPYEKALEKWHEQKREIEANERRRQEQQQAVHAAWQNTLNNYTKAKSELKVKDFDDAEDVVKDTLSVVQQGIIVQGAKNSAVVIYALGKNPKKAKEIASIEDPVKFAFAVADLENKLRVSPRKAPPPAEKTVSGTAPISGSVDSKLAQLRRDAEKTGDMSKVLAYKKMLKSKSK